MVLRAWEMYRWTDVRLFAVVILFNLDSLKTTSAGLPCSTMVKLTITVIKFKKSYHLPHDKGIEEACQEAWSSFQILSFLSITRYQRKKIWNVRHGRYHLKTKSTSGQIPQGCLCSNWHSSERCTPIQTVLLVCGHQRHIRICAKLAGRMRRSVVVHLSLCHYC